MIDYSIFLASTRVETLRNPHLWPQKSFCIVPAGPLKASAQDLYKTLYRPLESLRVETPRKY